MKKIIFVLIFSILVVPIASFAHPGNTASDGCHYCRTNCDDWGVAWNARHCHGGYTAPVYTQPTSKPILTATPRPTNTPTPRPTNTPMPEPTHTPTPEPTPAGSDPAATPTATDSAITQ